MSGRKASEVSSLLSKGENARQAGDRNFNSTVERCLKNIKSNLNNIDEIVTKVKNINLELSNESGQEFPSESNIIKKQYNDLISKVKPKNYDIKSLEENTKKANEKLVSLDNEAEAIRNEIRRHSHYCDNEYKRASILVNEYKEVSNIKNNISNSYNNLNTQSNIDLSEAKSNLNQINKLLEETKNLNLKAKQIVELRNKANEAKDFIKSLVNEIDKSIANKFMQKEFKEILSSVDLFCKETDSKVVNNLNNLAEKIGNFKHSLNEKYEKFKLEQSKAIENLNALDEIIKNSKYYNPMEYLKLNENAKTINVLEFLNTYAKDAYVDDINNGIKSSELLIEKEDFDGANKNSSQTLEVIEKALAYATLKQENLIKNANLALDIRTVMRKMNYETRADLIDGDITNGFKIECKVGDEIIDFDKVFVDDDGKVTIDIDHTESVTGTCGAKWKDIQQAFKEEGILLQDVTKNGNSILYGNRKSNSNTQNQRGTLR